ncbi:hypothetical protein AX16_006178 [Volvariella volvacea WC 439]|nr:hypothetical protein AX16_006178 [Volvariella volvacea WC 439]
MDRLESLTNSISQITMYDLKSMYNQAKNVVLNISEMEAKVREATNDDPWGASSTLMQEIAQGTFSFQHFNEIMPCIYARFMEKEARQWRQIYKALQLLEYIIKHGSERVVDDARSHISTIKMLRNFHYIDDKGKDEGANVRNRARELVDLLMDVDKIRVERRKAKANKHKYVGTGNEGFSSLSSGGRYSGFGSDSFGNNGSYSSNDFYNSGSSSSGGRSGGFRDSIGRRDIPEYDAGDDEIQPGGSTATATASRSNSVRSSSATPSTARKSTSTPTPAPAPAPAPIVDLLSLDDDFGSPAPAPTAAQVNKALPAVSQSGSGFEDDDFTDFQAAPASPTSATTPAQAAKPNLMDLLNASSNASTAKSPQQQLKPATAFPTLAGPPGHRSSSSISASAVRTSSLLAATRTATSPAATQTLFNAAPLKPSSPVTSGIGLTQPMRANTSTPILQPQAVGQLRPTQQPLQPQSQAQTQTQAQKKPASSTNFDDLWNLSLGSTSSPTTASFNTSKVGAAAGPAKSISDLQKEKSAAGLWGAPAKPTTPTLGGFGGASRAPAPPSNNGGFGGDDNLLL